MLKDYTAVPLHHQYAIKQGFSELRDYCRQQVSEVKDCMNIRLQSLQQNSQDPVSKCVK